MSLWTSAAIAEATGGHLTASFEASGVSIDTRTLRPGDLFVALVASSDGHAHAAQALGLGAAAVLVVRTDTLPAGAPAVVAPDTLHALTALGQAGRARFANPVIAVTGSVGKTTTKEMLRAALAPFGPVHAAEASYNNHWGVPLTLARLPPEAAACVAEIGMNNPGEIFPLARLAAPQIGIVTAIASAHIGHLGSLDAIAQEKASLLAALPPSGTAVIPHASPFDAVLRAAAPATGRVLTFGTSAAADAHPTSLESGPDGTTVQADIAGQPVRFRLHAPGAHMVANALATLLAAHAAGLEPQRAAAALEAFRPGPGRGLRRQLSGGITLLDESYNASVASIRAALAVLATLPATRRIAVLGDMLELGAFAQTEHESLAPDVARAADLLYACGPHTRALYDRVPPALRAAHAASAEDLAPIVALAVRPGDAVLVKGSLGSRMRVIVQALEVHHPHGAPG